MAYYCTKRRKWYVDSMNKRICILHALQMAMMILRTHTPATYIFCFSNFFVQQLWQQLFTWSFYVLPVTTRFGCFEMFNVFNGVVPSNVFDVFSVSDDIKPDL